jgi:hypothetical protein
MFDKEFLDQVTTKDLESTIDNWMQESQDLMVAAGEMVEDAKLLQEVLNKRHGHTGTK